MRAKVFLLVYLCLSYCVSVWTQQSIGLRAASFLRGILFGTGITVSSIRSDIDNGQYTQSIKENYQLVVLGTELKPKAIWKDENTYNFTDPDFALGATPNSTGWVQQNLMQIRGHNLVWARDQFTPLWLLENEADITSDKAKQLLNDYIHTVVSRYRGKILCWDVINEAIDDANNSNAFNIRDGFWYRKLGPDFMKYAFIFAHEADPNVKLYYNEYGIEAVGIKATRTLNLINWLRSQGATVHGIGLQWHIHVSTKITPNDEHYQIAQQFIDNQLDMMVTELDVADPTNGGYPVNLTDLQTQGVIYRSMLDYVLHFVPHCKAMLTWDFTDRYSWLPFHNNYTRGAGLPLDWMYIPKHAFWQLQEGMSRVVIDGVYRLSPQLQPDKCLGMSQDMTSNSVQLYSGDCNNAYQKWNITWQGDGTYRFSSQTNNSRVLCAYNATASLGTVQTTTWTNDFTEEWAFSKQGNNSFRVVPRYGWWRAMAVYGASNNISIIDRTDTPDQNWILTKLE